MQTFLYYILLFFTYSFIGWIIEVVISLVTRHKFINRGFLIGPICPVHGVGVVLITSLLSRYKDDLVVLFVMSVLVCSILEYLTSYLMEVIFKNRWWDYSNLKFNINGRICLQCSIPFGLAAIGVLYYGNPFFYNIYDLISLNILKVISLSLIFILIIDLCISFNIIINLKNISNTIKSDSTEIITKKVKEILLNKNILSRRLIYSFPNMQVKNKLSILKDKIKYEKNKIKVKKKELKRAMKKRK